MSLFSGETRKPREPRPTNHPRAPPRGYGYSYVQDPRVQAQWGPSQKAQSRGQSQKELCEVSGRDHPLFPSSYLPRPKFLSRIIRSVENAPSMSNGMVSCIHIAEEPVPGQVDRTANTQPATIPESLPSADIVDLSMPGILPFPFLHLRRLTHRPFREAVREGHAQPCTDCKKQPQAIDDLCLACHSSFGRSSDPRLKELSLDDPKAVSGTLQPSPHHRAPLKTIQLSTTSTINGKAPSQ